MAEPVFLAAAAQRFHAWAQILRAIVFLISSRGRRITETAIYESLSLPVRRQVGSQVAAVVSFLDQVRLLDREGHLLEPDITDLLELARIYFSEVLYP